MFKICPVFNPGAFAQNVARRGVRKLKDALEKTEGGKAFEKIF